VADSATDLTFNGVHLEDPGYAIFGDALFRAAFKASPPEATPELRAAIADKNTLFFRRYRPLNSFYYTGDRNKDYGYLDFLPAMRSFDVGQGAAGTVMLFAGLLVLIWAKFRLLDRRVEYDR
jgi:hypothetical protein